MPNSNNAKPPKEPKQPVPGAIAYNPPSAALVAGISVAELYNRIAAGEIRARKMGKRTLVEHEELCRFIANLPYKPAA
jgi:hypothetical protein